MVVGLLRRDDGKRHILPNAETGGTALTEEDPHRRLSEATSASVVDLYDGEQQGSEQVVGAADPELIIRNPPPLRALMESSTLPVVVGGLSGALAAIAAVLVLSELRPPMDPRVEPLAQHLGTFTQRMQEQETSLRAVEVDLVRALDQQAEVTAVVTRQNSAIETAIGQVEMVSERIRAESGPGSSVFGVAVVQLADGVAAGRPFEAEWVNLFTLTAENPALRVTLQRLLPFARSGVDTDVELRQRLRAGALRVDLAITGPGDIISAATDYIQSQFGLSLGESPAEQAAERSLSEADRRLAEGDVTGAIELVADLGSPFIDGFDLWLEAANRRVLADTVTTELTAVARHEISERARRQGTTKDGEVQSIGRRTAPLVLVR